MFFAGAWGYLKLLKLPVPPGQAAALPAGGGSLLGNSTVLLALAAMAVTVVLAGLLVTIRWFSPLAAGLPGLLLLAWTGLFLVSVRRAVAFIPLRSQAFGAGWEGLLFNGILGTAGAVMIFPLFVPSRWRARRPDVPDRVDEFLSTVGTVTPPPQRSPLAGPVPSGSAGRPHSYRRPRADGLLRPDLPPSSRGPRDPRDPREWRDPHDPWGPRDPRGAQPVDTTRVTGASRALRSTGSFRASTGSFRAAAGPMPMRRDDPRPTAPLETGADINSLLGRPYLRNGE
jgi:hypothetical protein